MVVSICTSATNVGMEKKHSAATHKRPTQKNGSPSKPTGISTSPTNNPTLCVQTPKPTLLLKLPPFPKLNSPPAQPPKLVPDQPLTPAHQFLNSTPPSIDTSLIPSQAEYGIDEMFEDYMNSEREHLQDLMIQGEEELEHHYRHIMQIRRVDELLDKFNDSSSDDENAIAEGLSKKGYRKLLERALYSDYEGLMRMMNTCVLFNF